MPTIEEVVYTGERNLRAFTQGFPTPYPAVGGTGGLHGSGADDRNDDARQASRHCASACGALTRVRRACLWRAQRAVPTSDARSSFVPRASAVTV